MIASPPRAITIPFISVPSTNSSRIASPVGRRRERLVQVRLDVVERLDAEDAALPARVGRLEHRREADLVGRAPALGDRAQRREARLRHADLGEPAAHRHLVRHQVRGLGADPGQPARLGDRRDHRHGAVGRDRQHAVELDSPSTAAITASASEKSTTRRSSASRSPGASGLRSTAARGARAPSPAGSRAAGAGPRRRRGRSSRRCDATRRVRSIAAIASPSSTSPGSPLTPTAPTAPRPRRPRRRRGRT